MGAQERGQWAGLVARLTVGGVWVVAGALKLPDPAESIRAVRAYRLLPQAIVPLVGYGLPILEVAIGLMLVLGVAVRFSAIVSALLLVAFLVGISAAWARGLQIDCGCFGSGGQVAAADTRYPEEITRDSGLLLLSLLLARWPRTRLALGTALMGSPAADPADDTAADPADDTAADPADDPADDTAADPADDPADDTDVLQDSARSRP